MPGYVFINGELVQYELARIPLRDRGLLSGLALYEQIRVEAAVPLRLERHVDKLAASISSPETALDFAISPRQLARDIATLCTKENLYDALATYILTPGEEKPWAIDKPAAGSILYLEPLDAYTRLQQNGIKAELSPYLKVRGNPLSKHRFLANPLTACTLKTLSAKKMDAVIFADQSGNLLDSSAGSLIAVQGNSLILPHPEKDGVYNDAYRELVLECAAREGMVVYQQTFTPDICAQASELFITSPGCIIASLTHFAGRTFKQNPVACKLLLACRERLDKEKPLL